VTSCPQVFAVGAVLMAVLLLLFVFGFRVPEERGA
jgi:hypothetical protein